MIKRFIGFDDELAKLDNPEAFKDLRIVITTEV